jgi:hypothetical protein
MASRLGVSSANLPVSAFVRVEGWNVQPHAFNDASRTCYLIDPPSLLNISLSLQTRLERGHVEAKHWHNYRQVLPASPVARLPTCGQHLRVHRGSNQGRLAQGLAVNHKISPLLLQARFPEFLIC